MLENYKNEFEVKHLLQNKNHLKSYIINIRVYFVSIWNSNALYYFPGSPFYCAIVDGTKATASGDGLRYVPANKAAYFNVHTRDVGDAEVSVRIKGQYTS